MIKFKEVPTPTKQPTLPMLFQKSKWHLAKWNRLHKSETSDIPTFLPNSDEKDENVGRSSVRCRKCQRLPCNSPFPGVDVDVDVDVENVNDYPVIPPFPFPFPGIHGVPFMSFHEHHSKIHHCFVLIILIQGFTCTTNRKQNLQSNYLFLEAAFGTQILNLFCSFFTPEKPHYSKL